MGMQDGEHVGTGEVYLGALRIRGRSDLARITFGAAVHELVEDEDVDSAGNFADEPGHPVELLQREILSERPGRVVSGANRLEGLLAGIAPWDAAGGGGLWRLSLVCERIWRRCCGRQRPGGGEVVGGEEDLGELMRGEVHGAGGAVGANRCCRVARWGQVPVRSAAAVPERAVRVSVVSDRSEVVPREQARPVPRDDLHVSEPEGRSGGEPAVRGANLRSGRNGVSGGVHVECGGVVEVCWN